MIEINLARQLQEPIELRTPSVRAWWLVEGILLLGMGITCWWWTQVLQQEVDFFLMEKTRKIQSLSAMHESVKKLEQFNEQKTLLLNWVERITNQEKEKAWPIFLLDEISQSIDRLDIWLERVQLEAQVVELYGQSLNVEDVSQFIEKLENDQVIRSLPVVEIHDRSVEHSEAFTFMSKWQFIMFRYRAGIVVVGILVFLLGMHSMIWSPLESSIQELQQDVARLDRETQNLVKKKNTLKSVEADLVELRQTLSSRFQNLPEHIELKFFRREVVKIAKRANVAVHVWKPEAPLVDLPHAETAIPITVRLEGNFPDTVQFLDELRVLPWVKAIVSLNISRKEGSGIAPLIITHLAIRGFSPSDLDHVQKLIKA
jgi:Tfp pilus assembly protein PilO